MMIEAVPHNIEAEQALLGALLCNSEVYDRVAGSLRPDHFYQPVHAEIYRAIEALRERGAVADPINVKGYFESRPDLDPVGGSAYLARLAASVVTLIGVRDYAAAIIDAWTRRHLIEIARNLSDEAGHQVIDTPACQILREAEDRLFALAELGTDRRQSVSIATAFDRVVAAADDVFRNGLKASVSTGYPDLDRLIGGLAKSDLMVLAGRPSMGKTALALNIAYKLAKSGMPVAIFSLEMSADQLSCRIGAMLTGVTQDLIRRGEIQAEDMVALVEAVREVKALPIHIDDNPDHTIGSLRAEARRLFRKAGIGAIIVDYIQLMRGAEQGRDSNRNNEISQITRGLKALAKELDVPVIALSQLSRQVESRDDKRPLLSDLRDSGSIEQDADQVGFLFREEYYLERSMPQHKGDEAEARFNERLTSWEENLRKAAGKCEVIVAKSRHAMIGTARLGFNGSRQVFTSLFEGDYR